MAKDHPEWDLTGCSGVDSDYWEAEVSAAGGATPVEEGVGSVDADDAARETPRVGGQETLETQAGGGTEQIVQIVDDEPTA